MNYLPLLGSIVAISFVTYGIHCHKGRIQPAPDTKLTHKTQAVYAEATKIQPARQMNSPVPARPAVSEQQSNSLICSYWKSDSTLKKIAAVCMCILFPIGLVAEFVHYYTSDHTDAALPSNDEKPPTLAEMKKAAKNVAAPGSVFSKEEMNAHADALIDEFIAGMNQCRSDWLAARRYGECPYRAQGSGSKVEALQQLIVNSLQSGTFNHSEMEKMISSSGSGWREISNTFKRMLNVVTPSSISPESRSRLAAHVMDVLENSLFQNNYGNFILGAPAFSSIFNSYTDLTTAAKKTI